MHNLSWVYFIERLYMFRAYPPPIIRRHTICLQQLVLIVCLDGCLFQPSQHNRQPSKQNNKYQLLETYGVPPDDGRWICPKHVGV